MIEAPREQEAIRWDKIDVLLARGRLGAQAWEF